MSILKVARMGHPVLRQKCQAIDPKAITGPEVQRLIRDMYETMVEYNGVGLAAPQVHQPVRLLIAGGEVDDEGRPKLRVLINPEITVLDDADRLGMYEGCLSVPGLRGWVERPASIQVKAWNEHNSGWGYSQWGKAIRTGHDPRRTGEELEAARREQEAAWQEQWATHRQQQQSSQGRRDGGYGAPGGQYGTGGGVGADGYGGPHGDAGAGGYPDPHGRGYDAGGSPPSQGPPPYQSSHSSQEQQYLEAY